MKFTQQVVAQLNDSPITVQQLVKTEMLKFYFGLGADIVRMDKDQPWGSGFLKRLSRDLKMRMPKAECFSMTNLMYMRLLFKLYAEMSIGHQVGDQLKNREANKWDRWTVDRGQWTMDRGLWCARGESPAFRRHAIPRGHWPRVRTCDRHPRLAGNTIR